MSIYSYIYGDTTQTANAVDASGTGRAEPRAATRVLLSPIQFRKRRRTPNSPSTISSSDDSDEYEDTDEQEFYTPDPAQNLDMDAYSSGGYTGDTNMSSEVDDDMDFYEVESSQPPVMADAVRSF